MRLERNNKPDTSDHAADNLTSHSGQQADSPEGMWTVAKKHVMRKLASSGPDEPASNQDNRRDPLTREERSAEATAKLAEHLKKNPGDAAIAQKIWATHYRGEDLGPRIEGYREERRAMLEGFERTYDHRYGGASEHDWFAPPSGPSETGVDPEMDRASVEGSDDGEWGDRAARMLDVPIAGGAQDLPNARDVMSNLAEAEIDQRKFEEYSMNPGHPHNNRKSEAWRAVGYEIDDPVGRRQSARDVKELLHNELLQVGKVDPAYSQKTPFGVQHRVLNGFIGPNGTHATLVTCWMVEDAGEHGYPRLTTSWLRVHREKEND